MAKYNLLKLFKKSASGSSSWYKELKDEFKQEYMLELQEFLNSELDDGREIYPRPEDIFSAFKYTDLNSVKAVVFGQDPYHGEGQAHGLSFSVNKEVKIPPSLANIYKELKTDLGIKNLSHGHLENWAKEGVLLLNAVLTVQASQAGSHQKKGWEKFTDKVVDILNQEQENLAFVLWGSHAHKKGKALDDTKHFVLKTVHPSPLSVYRGFYGTKPFSRINDYLESKNITKVNWSV